MQILYLSGTKVHQIVKLFQFNKKMDCFTIKFKLGHLDKSCNFIGGTGNG